MLNRIVQWNINRLKTRAQRDTIVANLTEATQRGEITWDAMTFSFRSCYNGERIVLHRAIVGPDQLWIGPRDSYATINLGFRQSEQLVSLIHAKNKTAEKQNAALNNVTQR